MLALLCFQSHSLPRSIFDSAVKISKDTEIRISIHEEKLVSDFSTDSGGARTRLTWESFRRWFGVGVPPCVPGTANVDPGPECITPSTVPIGGRSLDGKEILSVPPRAVIRAYFAAWTAGIPEAILSFYADDVTLELPGLSIQGREQVRELYVRPFCAAFAGNIHEIRTVMGADRSLAVEWTLTAMHQGTFLGCSATRRLIHLPGCSFFGFIGERIAGERIYFNMPALLGQIGGAVE
ncbi:MAG: nuclear transport factor 2 family protein [Bryobacteraceae bacterium]